MSLKEYYYQHSCEIDKLIKLALKEDDAEKDITSVFALPENLRKKIHSAKILCKQDCILSGTEIVKRIFKQANDKVQINAMYEEGEKIKPGKYVMTIKASLSTLLAYERTALNFLQRMSGIATLTNVFVRKLKFKHAKVLHTRKTTPNFRVFEIAAVLSGGGYFHRDKLSSAILIKDNHIASAGSVQNILLKIKNSKNSDKHFVEIEAKTLDECREIARHGMGINRVMLDNFNSDKISEAAMILKNAGFEIELSGGITEENFDNFQIGYIDFYSIGVLTHSYNSIDFSLEF